MSGRPESPHLEKTLSPKRDMPFVFDSYRGLLRDLGSLDANGAALSVAVHHFLEFSESQADPQNFAIGKAEEANIHTGHVDFPRLPHHLANLLIVTTYQQSEYFFRRFAREQRDLGRDWRDRKDSESLLDYCLSQLPHGSQKNSKLIWRQRHLLHEYYRFVRNAFVHAGTPPDKLANEFLKASKLRQFVEEEFKLEAPKSFDSLTFQDQMLFTRLVKYIATDLCRLGAPTSTGEILRYISKNCGEEFLKKFIGTKSAGAKMTGKLSRHLEHRFGPEFKLTDAALCELAQFIVEFPSKRERKAMEAGSLATVFEMAAAKVEFRSDDEIFQQD